MTGRPGGGPKRRKTPGRNPSRRCLSGSVTSPSRRPTAPRQRTPRTSAFITPTTPTATPNRTIPHRPSSPTRSNCFTTRNHRLRRIALFTASSNESVLYFLHFFFFPPPSNVIPEPLTRWRCYPQGIPAQDVALVLRSPGPSGNGRYGEVPRHPPRLRGHLLGHAHRAPDGRPGSLETNGNPTSTHPPRSTIPFQCVSA